MSSKVGGNDAGRQNEDVGAEQAARDNRARSSSILTDGTFATAEEDNDSEQSFGGYMRSPKAGQSGEHDHRNGYDDGDNIEDLEDDPPDFGIASPASPVALDSPSDSGSIPDDTPSLQGSQVSLPSRPSPTPKGSFSRTPSGALQPFERRFHSRFSPSPSPSPRAISPAFLTPHSRQSSISSQLFSQDGDPKEDESPQTPWEVVRWTRLRKLTGQAFSEVGKRQFGTPTCLAVSASIVIGTSKGLLLVFDYHQTLKCIIGQGTKAVEAGAITSLAISADYSTLAGGHATGHIFTWEIAHSARPFLHVPPVPRPAQQNHHPDGHVPGRAILHVGFLGTRHTALVSADDGGMAFSHLATRGLGAVGRTVKTTRLLGRYPAPKPQQELSRKPSSVLAFAPLPLGNVEQPTDTMGLTALLTPYLLVIVSTTPIAQTQHKSSRPKDITPHGALSGCLAWFPAVKLKKASSGKEISETKLVYCWSNVLTVLDVEVRLQDQADKDRSPELSFHPRSRWSCEEAIVAVQWLSRSVIGVLTISQRLVILEDGALHVMESVDLLPKHIYHRDVFSQQLQSVVEHADTEDSSMHGVIADAYSMSFRVYKGRLFLLGFQDISVGTMSNWADRLTALVEHGDDIGAIRLAVSYYVGDVGKVTVGLPDDDDTRHGIVQERLIELITASLRFTFSDKAEPPSRDRLRDLTDACFLACITMDDLTFLFDEVYDAYKDAGRESIMLDHLETYILEGEITSLPPPVVKDLVQQFMFKRQSARLEDLLCRLDPRTFDIDQITKLCKRHNLYDALIYVWNEALLDFVTPLLELLSLIKDLTVSALDEDVIPAAEESARKVYPYLAYSLTGRQYPKEELMDDHNADRVKTDIYEYLFSHQITAWPPGTSSVLRTEVDSEDEPPFPYLRLLLQYDAASFMSMLNEAFEDPFLNGTQDEDDDDASPRFNGAQARSLTRQHIISILLDTMTEADFTPEQTIFLDMFIARSLPKYPQFMILSGSQLQQVLNRLCTFRAEDMMDDCQLSVEYLLSIYHPPVTPGLIELLQNASFYRVLKSVYRSEHRYVDLLETFFTDPDDRANVFEDIVHSLGLDTNGRQATEIKALLCQHAQELANISIPDTSRTLARCAPDILERFIASLGDSYSQFIFLRTLLEPGLLQNNSSRATSTPAAEPDELVKQFGEHYVQLMCQHDPSHVADYIGLLKSGDLRLDAVLPTMEENGVIDAAVLLLAHDGLARDAMDRLLKHMHALKDAICSILEAAAESPDAANTEEAATDLAEAVDKYARIGIWLCQGQSTASMKAGEMRPRHHRSNPAWDVDEKEILAHELLWVDLIHCVVQVAKDVAEETQTTASNLEPSNLDTEKINNALRAVVQTTFTALLATTYSATLATTQQPQPQSRRPPPSPTSSFLPIFRAFLTRAAASAPSLSSLRAALLDIFTAYAHESSVLELATTLLGRDVFAEIADVHARRQQGWRPRGLACEICKHRAWGQGVGEVVFESWRRREVEREGEKRERERKRLPVDEGLGRGKGKASARDDGPALPVRSEGELEEERKMALVVFACRHVVHRTCLEGTGQKDRDDDGSRRAGFRCPVCMQQQKEDELVEEAE
ncbi:Vacuolar protein sorting-associated protein 8 [Zalaria obscura]|uniref:Vacuolar protein sorting-associated protein 8 n=1 Tax=Zalaria obscura TaxID=2024903 RepID=A0ACC3SC54_9PEZI